MSKADTTEDVIRSELAQVYTSLVREAQAGLAKTLSEGFTVQLRDARTSLTQSIERLDGTVNGLVNQTKQQATAIEVNTEEIRSAISAHEAFLAEYRRNHKLVMRCLYGLVVCILGLAAAVYLVIGF